MLKLVIALALTAAAPAYAASFVCTGAVPKLRL